MYRRHPNPLSALPTFARTPHGELKTFQSLSTPVKLGKGKTLMLEGAIGDEVMILIEGELLVERDGEPVAVLEPGAVVGEQAVLLHEPRNATVTAATDCTAVVMSRHEFSAVLDRCPHIAREILQTAMERTSRVLA